MNIIEMMKSKKGAVISGIAIVTVILLIGIVTSRDSYASESYWDLRLGDKTVAVFSTEDEAKSVIQKVKNAYVSEGSEVLAVSCDPKLSVAEVSYKVSEKPKLAEVDKTAEYLLTGTKEKKIYTIKPEDTVWDIASENGLTIEELQAMNEDKNLDLVYPDDELNITAFNPFVVVTTEQVVVSEKDIPYETEEQKTADLYTDQSEVGQHGECGLAKVTEQIKTENGKVIESTEKASEVIKEPVKEIVLVGTKERPSRSVASIAKSIADLSSAAYAGGTTYSGNGSAIANFACNYVGGPYSYGGSSLTGGADCSGFVQAVFGNFGIGLPHDAVAMRGYGRGVSMGEARPGDLICQPGHVGIYIGGGQMVHAVNERMGIAVTPVGYTGQVVTVRRIVE